jgi:NAD(P)-dependent dehydrogenase (short-subunit alcohol dehydrogenase family)
VHLEDRVAVVTGAGRGIGREIALALSAEGADIVLAARSVDLMEEVAESIRSAGSEALVVPTDLRDPEAVARLAAATMERFGRVDMLVNNSGVGGPSAPLWQVDLEDWREALDVNVTGAFLCCRAFLPGMIERGAGNIVNIGSITGKRPLHNRSPYATSKMALVGLTRTLAAETGPLGIRVNLISPGAVEGERIEWVLQSQAEARNITVEEARSEFLTGSPLRRLVAAKDVAEAVVFLASDKASAITGIDLNVTTGMVMY